MNRPDDSATPPPQKLLQIMMGAWASQIVGTLARFRVADALAEGPALAVDVAEKLGLHGDALSRVMRAAASVGVLEETDPGTFALTPAGTLLRSHVPGSMRALMDAETAPGHWLPWGRLDECLKTGLSSARSALGMDPWKYYAAHPEEARAFSEGMTGLSSMAIFAIDQAGYAPPSAKRIVDVGGAHGAFLGFLLHRLPEARGVLLDLPHVIETAKPALAEAGLGNRIECVVGDFLEAVPPGGDLYVLKHIVHDWDDDRARAILANVRRAMAPGATVIVVEMLIPEDHTPSPAALLDINMLVMLSGRERTASQMRVLFASAGLALSRIVPTHSPFSVLEATAA
jgi:predicted O-methyltransferase YrrM